MAMKYTMGYSKVHDCLNKHLNKLCNNDNSQFLASGQSNFIREILSKFTHLISLDDIPLIYHHMYKV